MKNKMKILFLSTLPYPLTAGGVQAVYNGISSVKDDVDAHLIYFDSIHKSCKKNVDKINALLENKVTFIPYKYSPIKTFFRTNLFIRNMLASFLKIEKKNSSYFF